MAKLYRCKAKGCDFKGVAPPQLAKHLREHPQHETEEQRTKRLSNARYYKKKKGRQKKKKQSGKQGGKKRAARSTPNPFPMRKKITRRRSGGRPAYNPGQDKFCTQCGGRRRPDDRFCGGCGTKLR